MLTNESKIVDHALSTIARQAVMLLRQEPDPDAAMATAVALMERAGLTDGVGIPRHSPMAFVATLIEENPLLRDAFPFLVVDFDPMQCETLEDLISNLMPGPGRLE